MIRCQSMILRLRFCYVCVTFTRLRCLLHLRCVYTRYTFTFAFYHTFVCVAILRVVRLPHVYLHVCSFAFTLHVCSRLFGCRLDVCVVTFGYTFYVCTFTFTFAFTRLRSFTFTVTFVRLRLRWFYVYVYTRVGWFTIPVVVTLIWFVGVDSLRLHTRCCLRCYVYTVTFDIYVDCRCSLLLRLIYIWSYGLLPDLRFVTRLLLRSHVGRLRSRYVGVVVDLRSLRYVSLPRYRLRLAFALVGRWFAVWLPVYVDLRSRLFTFYVTILPHVYRITFDFTFVVTFTRLRCSRWFGCSRSFTVVPTLIWWWLLHTFDLRLLCGLVILRYVYGYGCVWFVTYVERLLLIYVTFVVVTLRLVPTFRLPLFPVCVDLDYVYRV